MRSAAVLAGLAAMPGAVTAAPGNAEPVSPALSPPVGYLSFGPDEAALVEMLVDVLCPADGLTPRGVDCGLAYFIDRQLAGAFGKGERLYLRGPWRPGRPEDGYQLPLTPEQLFKAGLAAVAIVADAGGTVFDAGTIGGGNGIAVSFGGSGGSRLILLSPLCGLPDSHIVMIGHDGDAMLSLLEV